MIPLMKRFNRFKEGHGALDANYTGAYKNQLLYMDWIFDSLLQSIDESGLGPDTVVVFVNDHGEMVSASDGGIGHGWSLKPELSNIPLLVIHPSAVDHPIHAAVGSQVDILPTLLDYLGIAIPRDMPMQGLSLRYTAPAERRIYLGSYQDAAVIDRGRYFLFPDGKPKDARCYRISNRGAHTDFDEDVPDQVEARALLEDQQRFFKLQQSLIRHYESYTW